METMIGGRVVYRTKVMDLEHARAFARCLAANPRFEVDAIERSQKAKGDACWFVVFLPANVERIAAMRERQQDARVARAEGEGADYLFLHDKDGGRPFAWVFNPKSGETYQTTESACTCPDFRYRCSSNGLACKHMLALAMREGK